MLPPNEETSTGTVKRRSNNSCVAMAACECTCMKLNQAQNVPSTQTSLWEHKTAKPEKWPSKNTSFHKHFYTRRYEIHFPVARTAG